MEIMLVSLIIVFILSIVLFGYRKEYREDKKGFFRTLFGMPLELGMKLLGFENTVKSIQNFLSKKSQ